jgi:hypothetical protein
MKWPRNELQIKIKLVFKSGHTHEMWIKDLQQTPEGSLEWEHIEDDNSLLEFSPDEIAAILRVGSRTKTVWE